MNFDIETYQEGSSDGAELSYWRSAAGYCNMWKTEGYKNQKDDDRNIPFSLNDGDVVFYYANESALGDYTVRGTH